MADPRKAKRPGPLPMHLAIRSARINRKFDQIAAQLQEVDEVRRAQATALAAPYAHTAPIGASPSSRL